MSKTVTKIAIGAAIIGAAFVTGGASLVAAPGLLGVAVSATALGSVALGIGASLALSGVSQSLAKTPKVSLPQLERLNASMVPSAPRKIVLGQTAMATDIRYVEPSGTNQEFADYIIAVASHAVDGIDQIWLEDTLAWTGGGAQGKYAGYLTVTPVLEGSAANTVSINGGAKWGSSRRLTGCAYLRLRIKRTGNDKKAESPFAGGLPTRMTIVGRGAKLYDPRQDSTVPGGSGPMRADDQATWAYSGIGENLALQSLWYLMGWRINGRLAVGRGIPPARLDLASWIIAANLCDEPVTLSSGGAEPRYAGAGVVSEADDPGTVLQALMVGCNGRLRDGAGRLGLSIMHNDLALAATDDGLDDDDVLSPFVWNPDPSLEQTFNIVRGRYTDPSSASLYQPVPYPEVSLPSTDGIDRPLTLDLTMCESAARAQRIAKQVLQRKQYQRSFSAIFSAQAWKYRVGDVVPLTFAALGFNRRLFRVEQQTIQADGTCPMVLTEENAQIYAWDNDDQAAVQSASPIVYDSQNNPLILAVGDASDTAAWPLVTDPDGTKPDDNATNSADPASPFGPGGQTVAQVLLKLLDVDQTIGGIQEEIANLTAPELEALQTALAEARTDLDGVMTTVSGFDSRIDDAEAAVTAEAGARATAVDALAGSLGLVTTRVGNSETAISNEVIARSSLGSTIGGQITTINGRLNTNEVNISNQTSFRITADNALGVRIDNMSTRVGTAEGRITTTETTNANQNNALASLSSQVSAVVNPTVNLVTNSTFAQNGTGWSINGNWAVYNDANYHQIKFSQVGGPYTHANFSPRFSVSASQSYVFSFEAWTPSLAGGNLCMDINWYDSGDGDMGTSSRLAVSGRADVVRYYSSPVTSPPGAVYGRVRIFPENMYTDGNGIAVQKIMVQKGTQHGAWVEGSNLDTLTATVQSNSAAIANLQNQTAAAYWQVVTSVAGQSAKISAVARTEGGTTTTAVEIEAKQFTIATTSGGSVPVFAILGNTVQIAGNLVVTGSIAGDAVSQIGTVDVPGPFYVQAAYPGSPGGYDGEGQYYPPVDAQGQGSRLVWSYSVTVDVPAKIVVLMSCKQGYLVGLRAWETYLKVNGETIRAAGGQGGYTDSISMQGSKVVGAGTYTVSMEYNPQDGTTLLNNIGATIMAVKK